MLKVTKSHTRVLVLLRKTTALLSLAGSGRERCAGTRFAQTSTSLIPAKPALLRLRVPGRTARGEGGSGDFANIANVARITDADQGVARK